MAVGRRSDGVLLFAAVDGRHAGRALGLTLRTTGELLGALGCTDVLNLDGGSSKRMVVDGVAVDLASTEVRTGAGGPTRGRPVHTALLFQ
jgi:exopolysaccharide biosynthesis protein